MIQRRSVNKNIRKNIRGFHDPGVDMFARRYPRLTRVISILLVVIIPITTILFAANIVFRIPDLYNFELSRTDTLEKADITIEEGNTVGNAIAQFMRHKSDEFQILHEYHGESIPLFSENDQEIMGKYRSFLDKTFVVLIIFLIFVIGSFVFLFAQRWTRRLRKSFIGAIIVYLAMMLGSIFIFVDKPGFAQSFNTKLHVIPFLDDPLPMLFSSHLIIPFGIVLIAISLLLILIGNSITHYWVSDKMMFE